MAIKPSLKSFRSVTKKTKESLRDRAGITHWSPDGVASSLLDSITTEHRLVSRRMNKALESIQIGSAEGESLSALGETRNVRRLPAMHASTEAIEMNFAFYVSSGTFGDINAGADIILPAGTIVNAGDDLESGESLSRRNRVQYKTTNSYTLGAGQSIVYCSIKAETPGSGMNVAENVLIAHSFEDYSDRLSQSLLCTNRRSILNGRNLEDDESLRFRIANHYTALASSNETAISMKALTVPGVLKTEVVPNYYGIGTAAVFVFGIDKESNKKMVAAVQERISELQTPGLRIFALPGIEVCFDFELTVYTRENLTRRQRDSVNRSILKTMNRYFATNSSRPISRVSLREIHQRITRESDVGSLIVGRGDVEGMFDHVYIRKSYSGSSSSSERLTLDS